MKHVAYILLVRYASVLYNNIIFEKNITLYVSRKVCFNSLYCRRQLREKLWSRIWITKKNSDNAAE